MGYAINRCAPDRPPAVAITTPEEFDIAICLDEGCRFPILRIGGSWEQCADGAPVCRAWVQACLNAIHDTPSPLTRRPDRFGSCPKDPQALRRIGRVKHDKGGTFDAGVGSCINWERGRGR